MQFPVSVPFVFSQSYRRQDELPAPNNFPMYSESGSIGKIFIGKSRTIRISKPLFMTYYFRSRLALENPVTLAFLLGSDLENILKDDFQKFVDPRVGFYGNSPILANQEIPYMHVDQMTAGYPYRILYAEIPEFSDFPSNTEANYPKASFSKLVFSKEINTQIANLYLMQGNTFSSNEDILIENSNDAEFLYIFCYLPKIQRTEIAVAGRVNFMLEY